MTTPTPQTAVTRRRPAHAFTLIEMLVVIAIITVLVSIVVVAASRMMIQADTSATRITLQQVMSAATEYTAQTNQVIKFSGTSNPPEQSIETFVAAVIQVPEARNMILSIDGKLLIDGSIPPAPPVSPDGDPDIIIDPWEQPLQYRSWQRANADAIQGDSADLPERGSAFEPRPYVASSGPDEKFQTDDDLYSFELD